MLYQHGTSNNATMGPTAVEHQMIEEAVVTTRRHLKSLPHRSAHSKRKHSHQHQALPCRPDRHHYSGTPVSAARAPISNTCAKEKHQTTVVGATIGGLFGAIIVGLVCATLWLYKKEARQRKLKEHYEEQFSQTAAYRRNIASTVSLMGSELEEVKSKHSGA
jgi:hypothetical protein